MLNVYHTYIPRESAIIWKEEMYPQLLSVLEAKKNYGNISIYTNTFTKKQLKDIGLPYDNVDTSLLKKENSKMFSYYKLKVYENIKEEFLHIDTDTILYKNFEFNSSSGDFLFAHLDQPFTESINEERLRILTKSYSGLFFILEKQHSKFKIDNFKICKIPNMSIVYAKDPKVMSEATKLSLEHYQNNRELIDSMGHYAACYIEQLMIHLNLMEISKEYRDSVEYNTNVLSNDEFMFVLQDRNGESFDENEYKFPIRLKLSLPKNNPRNDYKFGKIIDSNSLTYSAEVSIPNKEFIKEMFDFDFFGVQHLSYNKWSKLFQCICIGYLHKHYGEYWIRQVHDYYKSVYPSYGLKTLSEGEKLYEDITGFKF
jgi:hypothetical protein